MDNMSYLLKLEEELIRNNASEEDISAAIQYADNLLRIGLPVIFDKNHFSLLVDRNITEINNIMHCSEYYYREIDIPKKSGGIREIEIPAMSLKIIQKWILNNILYKVPVSQFAMGFCKKKSIVTNANVHLNNKCIVSIDLENFFPSISFKQIFRIFYYYGYTTELSNLFARLCTYRGQLPQGAPTSPYLSNIVCLKLDKRLSGLAKKYDASYTRYADDITFSSQNDIKNIVNMADKIICDEGFRVNKNKTRVVYSHQRQEVTGLIVNNAKVGINKKYIKRFKQELYYCKKYGVSNHLNFIGCDKRFFKEHMYGKAFFINMIDSDLAKWIFNELEEIDWES